MKLTLAIVCALVAMQSASAQDQCPPLKRLASVDMTVTRGGGVVVPVSVAGQPLVFHLATSGSQSAISAAAADRLQLARRNTGVTTVNNRGDFSNTIVIARDLQVGNLHFPTAELREMIETPNPNAPQGVLSADMLRNYDVDLDFGGGKMNLISREHCADKVVYWPSKMLAKLPMRVNDDNRIVFKANLDGHTIEATIETSAPRTVLTAGMAKEAFNLDASSPGAHVAPDGERFSYRFGQLSVEGLVVKNPDIVIVPEVSSHMHRHGLSRMDVERNLHQAAPLRLGASTLRQLHVYIDYQNLTLYFTPAQPDAMGATESATD